MSLLTSRDLLRQIQGGRRLLADGGVGSELIAAGIAPERTVAANRTHPEIVAALHRRSLAAGAEVLTANTFGAPNGDDWAAEFGAGIDQVEAAAVAAARPVAVMVSVYPDELLLCCEAVLAPFRHPDFVLLIETAIDLPQAVAAVEAARSFGVLVIAATCHFQENGVMPDGASPSTAAVALQQAGASIVGGNCGAAPESMVAVAAKMRSATDLPLLFQPNAGLPIWQENGWAYPVDVDRFAATAAALFESGAAIVGGCCGTTPAHIAAARSLLSHPHCRE